MQPLKVLKGAWSWQEWPAGALIEHTDGKWMRPNKWKILWLGGRTNQAEDLEQNRKQKDKGNQGNANSISSLNGEMWSKSQYGPPKQNLHCFALSHA